jgi:glycosyltransferase involved in cell wall biosynthesis
LRRIAFIGNYLPRQCGIATFTTDVCEAVATQYKDTTCFAVPVNDIEEGYDYPPRVWFELAENSVESYRSAADFLNIGNANLVCLQHEYGIFGGQAGSYILELLRELRIPIVTTLHTVLREPDVNQREVLQSIAQLSDRLVVMSRNSLDSLREIYGVSETKVDLIPHGIPDVPFVDPNYYKDLFGVEGKLVLLTFGLLSPNKGIEYAIRALPDIMEQHPEVVYIVLGATHPNVKRHEGESYRTSLEQLSKELGIENNVIFHNRFVSLRELNEFIGAADIYITPYLNPAQSVSGTLAYTVGAGKAVVSTPYWYAEELLADGRGLLVPFQDAAAIATAANHLLDHEAERHATRKRAYALGREMIWSEVALRYMESFEMARQDRAHRPRTVYIERAQADERRELPTITLNHLLRITDDTGILQHAVFHVPNYNKGYTTDDNARALIAAVLLEEADEKNSQHSFDLSSRYMAFVWHAFDHGLSRFHNLLSYDRRWMDDIGSEDSHGRALWALGTVIARSQDEGLREMAEQLFLKALSVVTGFTSPRAWATSLLGICSYSRRLPGNRGARRILDELAARLHQMYMEERSDDWVWFEDVLTYDNAKLPQALLVSGEHTRNDGMVQVGLRTLEWLATIQQVEGHFVPIGSNGFYRKGGERARFDQQPLEACAMVSACLEAYRITSDKSWYEESKKAFDWFLGDNDLGLPLYDSETGGCYDGLHSDRVNQNQGAESTLSFILSLLEMRRSHPDTLEP